MQPLTSAVRFMLVSAVLVLPSTATAQSEVSDGITATDWSSIRSAYDAGRHAAYPIERPVSAGDMVATIYHLLGIDPAMTVNDMVPLTG